MLQLRMAPLKIARMKLLMPNSGFGNDVGMLLPRLQPGIKVFWMLIFVKKKEKEKKRVSSACHNLVNCGGNSALALILIDR